MDQYTLTTLRGLARMIRDALAGRRLLVVREDGSEYAVSRVEVMQPRGVVIWIEHEAARYGSGDAVLPEDPAKRQIR